jgi:hypothetical protein
MTAGHGQATRNPASRTLMCHRSATAVHHGNVCSGPALPYARVVSQQHSPRFERVAEFVQADGYGQLALVSSKVPCRHVMSESRPAQTTILTTRHPFALPASHVITYEKAYADRSWLERHACIRKPSVRPTLHSALRRLTGTTCTRSLSIIYFRLGLSKISGYGRVNRTSRILSVVWRLHWVSNICFGVLRNDK